MHLDREVAALEQKAEKLAKYITEDRETEPKAGIIKTRDDEKALAKWVVRVQETTDTHADVQRQIVSALSGRRIEDIQREITAEASRQAILVAQT